MVPVLAGSWMRGWTLTPSAKGCVQYPCSLHICPLCKCAGHVLCPCSVPWVSTHCRVPRPFNQITQWVSSRVILAVATRGQQRFSLLSLESASTQSGWKCKAQKDKTKDPPPSTQDKGRPILSTLAAHHIMSEKVT